MTYRVFLSHSLHDDGLALKVKNAVEATGVASVYLAEQDTQVGEVLAEKLMRQVRQSDAVVLLYTARSAASPYVHQEIGYALRDKPVLPLVEAGTPTSSLAMLAGREYLAIDPQDPTRGLRELATSVAARARAKDRRDLQTLLLAVGALVLVSLIDSKGQSAT